MVFIAKNKPQIGRFSSKKLSKSSVFEQKKAQKKQLEPLVFEQNLSSNASSSFRYSLRIKFKNNKYFYNRNKLKRIILKYFKVCNSKLIIT